MLRAARPIGTAPPPARSRPRRCRRAACSSARSGRGGPGARSPCPSGGNPDSDSARTWSDPPCAGAPTRTSPAAPRRRGSRCGSGRRAYGACAAGDGGCHESRLPSPSRWLSVDQGRPRMRRLRSIRKHATSDPARRRLGRRPMPTFVMLTTLTPEGVQTIKNNPQRIREVNKEVEQLGAAVKAQWAVLGRFDFVNVIEAPDEQTAARVSLELGSRGTAKYETLSAIPIEDFIASL